MGMGAWLPARQSINLGSFEAQFFGALKEVPQILGLGLCT